MFEVTTHVPPLLLEQGSLELFAVQPLVFFFISLFFLRQIVFPHSAKWQNKRAGDHIHRSRLDLATDPQTHTTSTALIVANTRRRPVKASLEIDLPLS